MKLFALILITFSASLIKDPYLKNTLIIWNVGQGQWVTFVTPNRCLHFDSGGEFFPWQKLAHACGDKENNIFLSHWDWDHIGALENKKIRKILGNACLAIRPLGVAPSKRKKRTLKGWSTCQSPKNVVEIWKPSLQKNSNAQSQVFGIRNVLLPGDSPKHQEHLWRSMPWIASTKILILGHHGSSTSTSEELLIALPHLKMAISSARWARYRHPHPAVVASLKNRRVPLLRTEAWGNIWIEQ